MDRRGFMGASVALGAAALLPDIGNGEPSLPALPDLVGVEETPWVLTYRPWCVEVSVNGVPVDKAIRACVSEDWVERARIDPMTGGYFLVGSTGRIYQPGECIDWEDATVDIARVRLEVPGMVTMRWARLG